MKFFLVSSIIAAGALGVVGPASALQPLDAPPEAILTGTALFLLASILRRSLSYTRSMK